MSTTPNMNMNLPVPTTTVGPDWAEELNTALEVVDEHDHSAGKGIPVPTSGINIDADLDMNSNKLNAVKAVSLDSQPASLSGASNVRTVYSIAGDLWYNNDAGVAVQVTSGTSVSTPSSPTVPAGIIMAWAGVVAPSGYLLCDGSAISRVTYASLFANIGTTYGVGDGSTTFNLPNLLGRVPVGAGTYIDPVSGSVTRTLGASAGAEKHVLTIPEMPSHNHTLTDPGHSHVQSVAASAGGSDLGVLGTGGLLNTTATNQSTQTSTTGITLANTGGGTSHNNMQPYLVLNYIIKST